MPIKLDLRPELDQAAARREANKAQQVFANAARGIGDSFSKSFSGGLQSAQSDVRKLATAYQKMYDKASDSAGKLRIEEEKLSEAREKGVTGSRLTSQIEKTNAARRAEARNVSYCRAAKYR